MTVFKVEENMNSLAAAALDAASNSNNEDEDSMGSSSSSSSPFGLLGLSSLPVPPSATLQLSASTKLLPSLPKASTILTTAFAPAASTTAEVTSAADGHNESHFGLDQLPDLILEIIFRMLPSADRFRLGSTCKRMKGMMESASVWNNVSITLKPDKVKRLHGWPVAVIDDTDRIVIEKFQDFFNDVEVVVEYFTFDKETVKELSCFAQRGILKRLKVFPIFSEHFCSCLSNPCDPEHYKCAPHVRDLIDQLKENTEISMHITGTLSLHKELYSCPKWQKCSLIQTLQLPESGFGESMFRNACPQRSETPTAVLISDFRALRVLEVSMHNLSDALLKELSSGNRSPLRKLVLVHKDYLITGSKRFPQVTSSAWGELTTECASMTVECLVRIKRLPSLIDVIKPETPLVKLQAFGEKDEENSECVQKLRKLCDEHDSSFQFVLDHVDGSVSSKRYPWSK